MKIKIGNTEIEGTREDIEWSLKNLLLNPYLCDSQETKSSIIVQKHNSDSSPDTHTKDYGHKDLIDKDYQKEPSGEEIEANDYY